MSKTIIALDFENETKALEFLSNFESSVYVKVGMELFYSSGPSIIQKIKDMGHKIFLDLKLHDIPNTVNRAIKVLSNLDIDMINVHGQGGIEMMKAALNALDESGNRPLLIAVTQLTSTSKEIMNEELQISGEVIESVIKFAKTAKEAGLDGVVCSVHEVEEIKSICGENFITVTPGIRLVSDSGDDQKRIATPEIARKKNTDYIVVGRSITKSEYPMKRYLEIEEIMRG